MTSSFELASGLGGASALLQAQLGLGLVLGALGVGAASHAELRKVLAGSAWEAALRAAAQAAGPASLLAVFALIQARAAAPDSLTAIGLLVAGLAVLLAAFLAVLGPILSDSGVARFSTASRVLSATGAFGQALLIFGAPPSGLQLLCASAFVRVALAVQALVAVRRALAQSPGIMSGIVMDLELVTGLAPMLGGLALVDTAVWGQAGAASVFFQPSVFCAALLALVVAVRLGLGGYVADSGLSELNFRFKGGEGNDNLMETPRRAVTFMILASMAFSAARVLCGAFKVEASTGGFSVEWGEPLTAAAAKLVALILGTYIAELAYACFGGQDAFEEEPADATPPINGLEMSSTSTPVQPRCRDMTTMDYVKALVAPAHTLLLALVAAHMTLPEDMQSDSLETTFSTIAKMPFRYGFVMAAGAVWMQVITLLVFSAVQGGSGSTRGTAEPPCDITGTLMWDPKGAVAQKAASWVRCATLFMLEGGLLFGCLGLNPLTFLAGGLITTICLYLLAPAEARQTANAIVTVGASAMFSCVGDFLEQRRLAAEAAAARRAAAVAQALEAESAPPKAAQNGGAAASAVKTSKTPPPKQGPASSGKKKEGPKKKAK